ncbi:MAG: DNA polymerase IV [Spirochaetia bacterium]|nr:DNA polymerase IV [Spirochaetia bacterium]
MPVYFHIDLDAFFASAEVLDRPELAGQPVIVGGSGRRGVVSTCSYEARAFGVHSAMPIAEARRLCPQGVYLPVRMERYAHLSSQVMSIFEDFTPDVIRVSIDEANLDMTGTEKLWGQPAEAAALLKTRVRTDTGLSVSIGIAPNRYIAKIASGVRKPDGLVEVPAGGEEGFMLGLPLDKIWGAGPKTQARLAELGIEDMARLRSLSAQTLEAAFGRAGGAFLYKACRGQDPGIYGSEPKSRSISTETTFERDVRDRETLESVLLGMAEELAARMYHDGHSSRTVVLKLRDGSFDTQSARETRDGPFISSRDIYEGALDLLRKKWDGRPVRLIGLGLAQLGCQGGHQDSLFEDDATRRAHKAAAVEKAVFDASRRGLGTITRARLVKPKREHPAAPDDEA